MPLNKQNSHNKSTRGGPARYKWSLKPLYHKWPYTWVTWVITPGVITLLTTGRGPPCIYTTVPYNSKWYRWKKVPDEEPNMETHTHTSFFLLEVANKFVTTVAFSETITSPHSFPHCWPIRCFTPQSDPVVVNNPLIRPAISWGGTWNWDPIRPLRFPWLMLGIEVFQFNWNENL